MNTAASLYRRIALIAAMAGPLFSPLMAGEAMAQTCGYSNGTCVGTCPDGSVCGLQNQYSGTLYKICGCTGNAGATGGWNQPCGTNGQCNAGLVCNANGYCSNPSLPNCNMNAVYCCKSSSYNVNSGMCGPNLPMSSACNTNGGAYQYCGGTGGSCSATSPCPMGQTCVNGECQQVPEMSDCLAMAFVAVAGGMIHYLRRRRAAAHREPPLPLP